MAMILAGLAVATGLFLGLRLVALAILELRGIKVSMAPEFPKSLRLDLPQGLNLHLHHRSDDEPRS